MYVDFLKEVSLKILCLIAVVMVSDDTKLQLLLKHESETYQSIATHRLVYTSRSVHLHSFD